MKQVLVTGGTGGIGRAVVKVLSAAGYEVHFTYFSGKEAAKMLEGCRAHRLDLADANSIRDVCRELENVPLYGIVHCAGLSLWGPVQDAPAVAVQRCLDVNLCGPIELTRRLLSPLIRAGQGRVVFMGSIWGDVGASCEAVYSASKGGLASFTKALAKELGPSGVTVNCISPGLIDTPMNARFSEENLREFLQDVPLGRMGTPHEVAALCRFLLSEDAAYLTGQIIHLNGGME